MVANRTINLNMYTAALTVARHYKEGNLNWPMIIYIGLAHVAALVGLVSLPQCNKWTLLWAFVLWPITGFGITGGVSENSKLLRLFVTLMSGEHVLSLMIPAAHF